MSFMTKNYFPHGIAGIIFDCDGVMIDSEDANRYYYNTILDALGLPPMTDAEEEYAFMATARDALLTMVPKEKHVMLDETMEKTIDYHRDILPRVKLMPGFLDFIAKAHEKGLKLAIDTNRTALGIQRILDFFNLPPYFNPVISATVANPKPDPQGVAMIRDVWGVPPEKMLFIGDSDNDKQTAQNSGAIFAAFGGKGLNGDMDAPDYQTLAHFLWPDN